MELTPQPLLLIEEVKKHEGLWSSSLGVTREERMEMWKQVGAGMYPDWSAHSKAVQYDIIIQLQSKWRSIRDGYNRELRFRKTGVRKYNKTYVYFKKLLFLGGYDGEVSSEGEEDKVSSKKARKRKSITLKKSEQVHCPSDEDPEPQYLELDEEEPSSSHYETPNKQIKIESCSSVAPTPDICEVNLDSGQESDRLYLLSFLPELSQLPRTIKMWAKTQIAQIMEEAVNQQLCGIMPNRPIKRDPISD